MVQNMDLSKTVQRKKPQNQNLLDMPSFLAGNHLVSLTFPSNKAIGFMKKSLHLQSGQQRGWEDVPFLDARKLPLALVFDFTPGSSTTVFCMKHHLWWGFAAIYSTQMSIYTARHFIHPKKLMPEILLVTMAVLPMSRPKALLRSNVWSSTGPGMHFFFKKGSR